MFGTNRLASIVLGGTLAAFPAAQESNKSEVGVQLFGSFVKTPTDDGIRQSSGNSAGVLEIDYGYSRNTQSYRLPTGAAGIDGNQHEFSAAYVYRRRMGAVTPFVKAGVGGLVFAPTHNFLGGTTQAKAAFGYGAGADFVTHRAEPSIGVGYRL